MRRGDVNHRDRGRAGEGQNRSLLRRRWSEMVGGEGRWTEEVEQGGMLNGGAA